MKKLIVIIGAVFLFVLAGGVSLLIFTKSSSNIVTPPPHNQPISADVLFVNEQLANMTLRQKISNLLILHASGYDATTLQNYLQTYQPGGLIFMGDNIPTTTEELTALTNNLQSNVDLPYLFAIDEEGGVVSRLPTDNYPAAVDLKTQPSNNTEIAFRQRSQLLKQVGMNLNFGIVADVTNNPNSFIYERVFGGDPPMVSERVAAAVDGTNGLTLSTLKHFPGHGETESDSHTSIPLTDISYEMWQTNDKPPFVSGIKAGANVVMFGHLIYSSVDSLPASLSVKWHQILSDKIGFTGISITDDMIMLQQSGDPVYADPITNAISALQAGNTMLLYVLDHGGVSVFDSNSLIDGVVAAVSNGSFSQTIIDENVRHVLTLRHSLSKILVN